MFYKKGSTVCNDKCINEGTWSCSTRSVLLYVMLNVVALTRALRVSRSVELYDATYYIYM
jgi:hypothetical protein